MSAPRRFARLLGPALFLLLTACAGGPPPATPVASAAPVAEPVRIVVVNDRLLACQSAPGWAPPTWRSVCAPLGPPMPCTETEKRLDCRRPAERGARAPEAPRWSM